MTEHDQTGTTLWAWVTEIPGEGVSQISIWIPALGVNSTLTVRSHAVAEKLRSFAERHRQRTGQRVWLREYSMVKDHGELTDVKHE